MGKFPFIAFFGTVLLAACGSAPTPQPTIDIVATTNSLSATMVAGTLTAQPTATAISTSTPEPSATPTEMATATPISSPTVAPTEGPSPTAFSGMLDPLGANTYTQGIFRIENLSDEKKLIVTITGMTNQGNPKPVYIAYEVTGALNFNIPWGDYQYVVQIGDKRTITGSFIIRNLNKTTMKVSNNKVNVIGP